HKKIYNIIKNYGVCVIENVINEEQCDEYKQNLIKSMIKLNPNINVDTKEDIKRTWTKFNLPPQVRPGLFQSLCSNFENVWDIRKNNNIKNIYKNLYNQLRNYKINKFIISGDGINLQPPYIGPYTTDLNDFKQDWCHLDQT